MPVPTKPVRLVFAGTPDFAVPCLAALAASAHSVECVLTQPDRPAGRGRKLQASPVKQLALEHGIDVMQPEKLDADTRSELQLLSPDLLVVVAYGLILPDWMLNWPAAAAVNVHASLLPRWRGASPIQQAILAGDTATGVSIMRMSSGLDCGPVYARHSIDIGTGETAGELHDRLAALGAEALLDSLPAILDGSLKAVVQDEKSSTYAPKISKRDALLDWSLAAPVLQQQVCAYNPWPVAETQTAAGERLRIWRAQAEDRSSTASPGTVIGTGADGIDVATGEGVLRLTEVQAAGGRSMSSADYLAGHDIDGQQLGRR